MIELSDVVVSFGDHRVLDGVSLTASEGELLTLVGPNGAGKTTLLRTINGYLTPDRGEVSIDGTAVAGLSPREIGQLVATVPQSTSINFKFSVRDLVAMGRTPHRRRLSPVHSNLSAPIERALDRTDTAQFADRPVNELSGGQRQRVLVARALAQETPALILDEPTANLDINHQMRLLSLIEDLVAEGKTVIAAIHDLDLAARVSDRIALLADGELATVGAPEAVLTADQIEAAFDVSTTVTDHPVTDSRIVTPLPEHS